MNVRKARPLWPGLLASAVLLAGCGDGPATFAEAVCPATLEWRERMAERVEGFAHDSRAISDPSERRERYLELYDRIARTTEAWVRDVEDAPDPATAGARELVLGEAKRFLDSLALDRAETEGLDLDAFEHRAVAEGDLLKEIEKATARTRARFSELGEPGVDAGCGRTPVVGDPSRRL